MNAYPCLSQFCRASLLLIAVVGLGLNSLLADSGTGGVSSVGTGKGGSASDSADVDSARSKAFGAAFDVARRGDVATAEQSIAAASHFRSDTPEFDLDVAAQLTDLGAAMARDNRADRTADFARRALTHAEQAAKRAASPLTLSKAKAHAAFIREKLMGDIPGAISNYQDAVAADPSNRAARERLEHLKEMDAFLRARVAAAKKD